MHIIKHLGSTDNEYLLAITTFRPSRCPACGHASVHYHDRFSRQGRQQQVPILRFRCGRGRCQQVFSVLPSYLPARQSYSAATEETVVATYASGAAPLATVAASAGVSTTTAFRWVDRLGRQPGQRVAGRAPAGAAAAHPGRGPGAAVARQAQAAVTPAAGSQARQGRTAPAPGAVAALGATAAAGAGGDGWQRARPELHGTPGLLAPAWKRSAADGFHHRRRKGALPPAVVASGWRCSPVTEDGR